MYRTISINNNTFQQIQAIATRLDKPKTQVINDLIQAYSERMNEKEKRDLVAFNAHIRNLSKQIKLPKGTIINTDDLDKDFALLADDPTFP